MIRKGVWNLSTPNPDDSAKLAAVRDVLSNFDWESDDRQYALEAIDLIVTAAADTRADDTRAAFIAGLRDLADYLTAHEDVPTPDYSSLLHAFPDGDSNDERRAAVDAAAAVLGTDTAERPNSRQYYAERKFGPITYSVVTIDDPTPATEIEAA
jgi:hypothetical protein